jgi:hypothetical protein
MRTRSASFLLAALLPLSLLFAAPPDAHAAAFTFTATADASVSSSQAAKNFGRTTSLPARQTASAATESFLSFQVTGLSGTIRGVRLRLNATDPSVDGGTIYAAAGPWTEASITWRMAPSIGITPRGTMGAVPARGWREVALDPTSVTTDGTYSFVITSRSSDQVTYSSRETSNRPQLIVETDMPVPSTQPTVAPATMPPTATLVPTAGATLPPPPASTLAPPSPTATEPDGSASPPPPSSPPTPTPPAATLAPAPTLPPPTLPPSPPAAEPYLPADPSLSRSILIAGADLVTRPMAGDAWSTLAKDATGVWPAMSTSSQDAKHARLVVAGALYAARTGDPVIRDRVAAALYDLSSAPWYTDMLALARQLSGYVIAADLIGYRDPAFVAWVDAARTRIVDDHVRWTNLSFTAGNTTGNWGTWSLASLTAADLYLGDTGGVLRDWSIFAGYGVPFASGWAGGPFVKTSAWDPAWSSVASDGTKRLPIGLDVNGALVEDSSRSAGATLDSVGAMYDYESVRAITTTALLFRQAGYDATRVTDSQLRRLVDWLRATPYDDSIDGTLWGFRGHGLGPWARFGLNELLGTTYPTDAPTNTDRHFGYTDWLYP